MKNKLSIQALFIALVPLLSLLNLSSCTKKEKKAEGIAKDSLQLNAPLKQIVGIALIEPKSHIISLYCETGGIVAKINHDINDNLTDVNFPNPTRVLKPGDKLRVRAFKQVVGGTTTSEERMAFLATQKAIHTGAQGASLVFDQKRDQLPKGKWYCSFDQKDRLWQDSDDYHRVPYLYANSDGDWNWNLGNFENSWNSDNALLCFCHLFNFPLPNANPTGWH